MKQILDLWRNKKKTLLIAKNMHSKLEFALNDTKIGLYMIEIG